MIAKKNGAGRAGTNSKQKPTSSGEKGKAKTPTDSAHPVQVEEQPTRLEGEARARELALAFWPLGEPGTPSKQRIESMTQAGFDPDLLCDVQARAVWAAIIETEAEEYDVLQVADSAGVSLDDAMTAIGAHDHTLHKRIRELEDEHRARRIRSAILAAQEMHPDEACDYLAEQAAQIQSTGAALVDHGGQSLADLATTEIDTSDTLLGDRYLCRQGALLFVGPSGIGKSSASVQQDLCWAMGRAAFGIAPARPLRILCIQAENDLGDMAEMAQGISANLQLTDDERELVRRNTLYISHRESIGADFVRYLGRVAKSYKPDLVRIDPLQAYLGADPADTARTSEFLRAMINPLLRRLNAGLVLNHHTPKTNHRDATNWSPTDWMYAGSGSAELTNWARAVLVIDPEKDPDDGFRFIAAKRGRRIGWRDEHEQRQLVRWYGHAAQGISWHQLDEPVRDDESGAKNKKIEPGQYVERAAQMISLGGMIEKSELRQRIQDELDLGEGKAKQIIREAIKKRAVTEYHEPRPGTRPLVYLMRAPERAEK